jgi:hypothetical protein
MTRRFIPAASPLAAAAIANGKPKATQPCASFLAEAASLVSFGAYSVHLRAVRAA